MLLGMPAPALFLLLCRVTHTPCAGAAAQVLRLTVEATGMARRLCAPREVIVERLFKRYVQLSGGQHVLTTVSQACRAMLLLCVRQHMLPPACREYCPAPQLPTTNMRTSIHTQNTPGALPCCSGCTAGRSVVLM